MNRPKRWPKQSRLTWLLMTAGLAAAITALTLMPQASMPAAPKGVDKLYHIVAFAALIFPTALLRPRWCLRAGILAVLYGGIIEVIQPTFGRTASAADLLADAIGVLIGISLGLSVRWAFGSRKPFIVPPR